MGLYRNYEGDVIETTDENARQRGYKPYTVEQEAAELQQRGIEQGKEDRAEGIGTVVARRLAGGLSLGLTDVATAAMVSENQREDIVAGMEAHPIAGAVAETVGALLPLVPGAGALAKMTPAGYLSQATTRMAETGGAKAVVKAAGVEGAVQNAGQYIGHAALEDKDVTVEGLAGAAGLGFGLGAAGGGIALGLEKGTIAARRMFSRSMDGGKDAGVLAASEWETRSKTILDADEATAEAARRKLQDYKNARRIAQEENLRAKANLVDEQTRAAGAPAAPGAKKAGKVGPDAFGQPMEFAADGTLPELGAELPGPRRVPQVDASEPFVMPETMSVGDIPDAPTRQLGDEAFAPPPRVHPDDARVSLGPTEEPVTLDGADIHQMVKEMQRRSISGEKFRGMRQETISDYRARTAGPPDHLAPFDPAEGSPWVSKQQSVTGLKNVRERFGRLTREDKPLLGKAIEEDNAKLEAALAEFEASKADLMKHIGGADTKGLQPLARDPRVAEDIAKFTKHGETWQGAPSTQAPDIVRPDNAIGRVRPGDEFRDNMIEVPDAASRVRSDEFAPRTVDVTVVKNRDEKWLSRLDDAYDDAVARAENAVDDVEREAATAEANAIRAQMDEVDDLPDNIVGDVAKAAEAFNRYEKASAELAEAAGDAAHPFSQEQAKAWSAANDDAVRKTMDRITQSVEDAETFGVQLTPKERVAQARQYKEQTAGNLSRAREAEAIAREEAQAANKNLKSTQKRLNAERKEMFPEKRGRAGFVEGAGALELLSVPGMPSASDLPVVGPFLSAYLKYRTLKAAMGRFTGRVPVTPNAKAAALAAKTKDRVAKAIDKSLGVVEKGAKLSSSKVAPLSAVAVGRVLSQKIFDDGGEDPKKDDLSSLGTARAREIISYVTTPGAIEKDVRREMRGITDPDLIVAAEKHRRQVMQHLADTLPKQPDIDPLNKTPYLMSPMEALSLGRRLAVINNPATAFEATTNGTLTLEAAQTLREAFPRLFELGQKRLLMKAGQLKESVPYRTRVMMSMLYDVPLDRSLDPRNIRIMQSVYTPAPAAMPQAMGNSAAPPPPAIASDVNVTALYQTASDRAASRR